MLEQDEHISSMNNLLPLLEQVAQGERPRSALQNAASVTSLLLTTEAPIAEKPKKTPDAGAMPGMGDMEM